MNVMIIGTGAREVALAWKLAQSPAKPKLYMEAPARAALAGWDSLSAVAEFFSIDDELAFCRQHKIDLAIIGGEVPLLDGLGDRLRAGGIKVFGPSLTAAQLEGSKFFTRTLCAEHSIPSPSWAHFDSPIPALAYADKQNLPLVIKADGLAAGKGVTIAQTKAEVRQAVEDIFDGKFGTPSLVIEECMTGEEASFFVLTDGTAALPFGTAQDHKRAFDGDQGPNTGGMGAISPAPILPPALVEQVMEKIIHPTLRAMKARGTPFQGVLYAGLMIERGEAKLVEFNVRFGDPECQLLMMRLEDDLLPLLLAVSEGNLTQTSARWSSQSAALIVMAAKGYPGTYQKGTEIKGLEAVMKAGAAAGATAGAVIFSAALVRKNDEHLAEPPRGPYVLAFSAGNFFSSALVRKNDVYCANGGRVLNVAALGKDLPQACEKAYGALAQIDWQEGFYRTDIGKKYRGDK